MRVVRAVWIGAGALCAPRCDRCWKLIAAACVAGLLAVVGASPAVAGQIVYRHGVDLWVMNDNGSHAHVLLTAGQVGGPIETGGGGSHSIGVKPGGTGIAFDAAVPPAHGICDGADHCPGIYSLVNGKLTRLSPAAAPCSAGITYCGGEETDPSVTSNGRVVYDSLFVASTPDCGIYYCGTDGDVVERYYVTALDGDQTATVWPLPQEPDDNDQVGADPNFDGALATDPANPNKVAYGGNALLGVDLIDDRGCGTGGQSNCYPLDVESHSGTYNQPTLDDSFYYGLAFSPNGSKIADIETGNAKGVWVYPANQTWGTLGHNNPAAKFTWALKDPDEVAGAGEFDQVINGLTFAGETKLVFSADYNLWSIPARCWATATNASAPAANCHFPRDATELTHNGTAAKPNLDPAWTASTATIARYATAPLKLVVSASQKVLAQRSLKGTLRCTKACSAKITGSIRIEGSTRKLSARGVAKRLAAGTTWRFALKLLPKPIGRIRSALHHHHRVSAHVTAATSYAGGHRASSARIFAVQH